MPLKPRQPPQVADFHVPIRLGQEPVEAGLVASPNKLAVDSQKGLPFGDHQSREVFGKVSALSFVSKYIPELLQSVLNGLGELGETSHDRTVRRCHVPSEAPELDRSLPNFTTQNSKMQKSRYMQQRLPRVICAKMYPIKNTSRAAVSSLHRDKARIISLKVE